MTNTIDMKEYPELPEWRKEYNGSQVHCTAMIGPNVKIGTGTYIGPYCIIGFSAEHKAFWGKEQMGVEIGDNCKITGHVTIDAGTERPTIIADKCWLLKHSHIGHDALICEGSTISCGALIGGHTTIGLDCNIGLNASIHQKLNIPQGCMIGMNACVTKTTELKPFRKYAGVPAKEIGMNTKEPILGYFMKAVSDSGKFQILGCSGAKSIFVVKGVKDGPVMIFNHDEGKVYTSGLGMICSDMRTLFLILKLLGHNLDGEVQIDSINSVLGKAETDQKVYRGNTSTGH